MATAVVTQDEVTTQAEAVEILHNARALIARPWGWTKFAFTGDTRDGGTRYCAVGALKRAADLDYRELTGPTPYEKARNALRQALPEGHYAVTEFNDRVGTHKKDVLALYDRAIDLVKKGG